MRSRWSFALVVLLLAAGMVGCSSLTGGGDNAETESRLRSGAETDVEASAVRATDAGYPHDALVQITVESNAYPPPGVIESTSTPPPDAAGLFAPPDGVCTEFALAESSNAEIATILGLVDHGLQPDGVEALAESVFDDQGALTVFPLAALDGDSGDAAWLDRAATERTLRGLLEQGAEPVVQGYFDATEPGGVLTCADVLVTGITRVTTMQAVAPHLGGGTSDDASQAAIWQLCSGQGSTYWTRWIAGGYHELVSSFGDYGEPDRTYSALRPAADFDGMLTFEDPVTGFAVDYPALWDAGGSRQPVAATGTNYVSFISYDMDCVTSPGSHWPPGIAKVEIYLDRQWRDMTLDDLVDDNTDGEITVTHEEPWELGDGVPAVRRDVTSEVGGDVAQLITVINGRGMIMIGFGDLTRFDEIARTLRPTP